MARRDIPGYERAERRAARAARQDRQQLASMHRAQYLGVKRMYPDAVVLLQVGAGYEAYDHDARVVAAHQKGGPYVLAHQHGSSSVMVRVPAASVQPLVKALNAKGWRVAVVDQVSARGAQ